MPLSGNAGWRETLTLGATHAVHLSAGPWRSTLEIPQTALSSASDSSFPVASHQPAPPAPLESIISFLLQTSPRGGAISLTFLRIWFTRNCLSGESYFPPVYLALSLNWSLFLAVLIAIFLSCSPVVGSPSTHPFSRFSLVGTFFYIFCSELPIPLIFPPSLHPRFWSQSHPVSGLLWLLLISVLPIPSPLKVFSSEYF